MKRINFGKLIRISYLLFAFIHLWYLIIRKPADYERAKTIYNNFGYYMNSSLYLFVASIPLTLTISIATNRIYLVTIILLAGIHLILTMVFTFDERQSYWNFERDETKERHQREQMERALRWRLREEEIRRKTREFREEQRRRAEESDRRRKQHQREQEAQNESNRSRSIENNTLSNSECLSILGLPQSTTDFRLVKSAYRQMIKKHHPDVDKSNTAEDKSKLIITAYKRLEGILK